MTRTDLISLSGYPARLNKTEMLATEPILVFMTAYLSLITVILYFYFYVSD